MRFLQYVPKLKEAGIDVVVSPLFDDAMLRRRYRREGHGLVDLLWAYLRRVISLMRISQFDLVWIEKESLPWFPVWVERLLLRGRPYVLDFDDAIFHNYDLHRNAWVRRIYGQRIDHLMRGARLVVAGNRYLADRAIAAGARSVEVIPTVVDAARYEPKVSYLEAQRLRIVWIGSPSTAPYLLDLAGPLANLASRKPFTLRVIGGGAMDMPGVDVEVLPWSDATEAAAIAECDIGIMPLRDTPWEQGKCAYKLIQYMASGLPTVASPIGANREVVVEGETGYFAVTPSSWPDQLERLLADAALRERLGKAGRRRVETEYCLQQAAPRLIRLLAAAGGR